jgi:hypothetical protein
MFYKCKYVCDQYEQKKRETEGKNLMRNRTNNDESDDYLGSPC